MSDFTDSLTLREPYNRLAGICVLAGILFSGLGCSPQPPRIVTIPAVISAAPEVPILPSVSSGELQCLADDAYERLVVRQLLLVQHIEVLHSIIERARNPIQVEDKQ